MTAIIMIYAKISSRVATGSVAIAMAGSYFKERGKWGIERIFVVFEGFSCS